MSTTVFPDFPLELPPSEVMYRAVNRLVLISLGLTLLLPACKPADPVATPVPAVDVAGIRAAAENGKPEAQAKLGRLYMEGQQGLTNSYDEAARWFKSAADQGNADGLAGLGELHDAGQGVKRDRDLALKYYRMAAEKGHAGAQYNLGFAYESGRGLPQDHEEAAKWFKLAAEQGEAYSQYDLGQRYILGVGVPKDTAEAYKWLSLAAAQGQPDSAAKLQDLKAKMSKDELAEGERRLQAFGKK